MKKRIVSLLLAVCMILSLLTGCGSDKKSTDSNTGSDDNGTYTYRQTYSSVSTWSPTDWEISSEFPIDKTADYAGNETYGVPADATEGYAWQVSIRDDATWEDGTPITVDDIEYSIQQFLNPEMKNYRASLLYSGSVGLANGEDYYNNDKAGKAKLTVATDLGIAMSDLTAGSDGQYADKDGNKAYFGWSNPINNDWMQGYALTDYADYMSEDVYNSLDALANEDGYIPMTDESIKLLHSFTGSADWGGESEEDLINYAYREDGITEEIPWENVGFVKNDDYTFTLVLKNPTTLFNFESDIDNVILVKKDLYEANKQETGGIYKSSYGTAVDKFSSYGPYKITSYQESKEIKLEKNENWYGYKDGNHEGQYQTTNILWQQIDEHTTQLSMFLQGNLDIVGLASDDMEKYGTSDYVYYTPESYTYYLALNTDFDMLKSRESDGVNKTILTYNDFRKAISFAIDRNDYVKSCTAGCNPAYGLLNDIYICDPDTGATYRDTEYAQKTLCDVYEVDDLDNLTGYDKKKASELLQSAYDQCKKDGNISDTDVIEIDYHSYGSEAIYQKRVDYVQDALLEAAKGTSLEGRIKLNLVEDQDLYNTMKAGQDDMILGAWGGADLDPYSMMICYTDPTYINEYGFDPYQNLTISVQGEDITMSFYDWYNELYTGTYAVAERDVRNEILAGIEKGLLLNYHVIPIDSSCAVSLYSQRVIPGSEEYINSIVQRGGIQFLTYTMNDDEWDAYCKEQGNNLSY